jgi:hypothetical protein
MLKRFAIMLSGLVLTASPVLAQVSYPASYLSSGAKDISLVYEWLFAFLFTAGCLFVAFKPAGRAHLK